MATPNLSITLPTVGGSTDTWGTTLNTGITAIDALFSVSGTDVSMSDVTFASVALEETGAGTDTVKIQAPSAVTASYTLTMPVAVGSTNQVLSAADNAGTLAWTTPVTGDITGVTAGAGMTGGGTSGDVTLNVIGTADKITVSADALTIAATYVGQTSVTTLGTIATGVWNGTKVASAYLDDDTAHLSGTQTLTGAKTFSAALVASSTLAVTGAVTAASTLAVTGTSSLTGNVGIGAASSAAAVLNVTATAAGAYQYGIFWDGTLSGTTESNGIYASSQIVAGTAVTDSMAIQVATAGVLSGGATVTNQYGFRVLNQGKTGQTNAYGIYIAAQSGAATLNWGLLNEGTTSLVGAVTMGSTLAVTGKLTVQRQVTSVASHANSVAMFEGDGALYATFVSNGVSEQGLLWADAGSVAAAQIVYAHSTDTLSIHAGAVVAITGPAATIAGTLAVTGALSKGSGSFKIDHPLPAMRDTHHLVHSFVEGPRADLIYRGVAALSEGSASVDLDAAAQMSAGTWELLCRDPQVWVQNDSGWAQVRGSVAGSTLTIACEDLASTDSVSWMVVAERCDEHIMGTDWTDENGRVIVEPEKVVEAPAASVE